MDLIVIIGIMVMTVSAGILMISFSNDQIRYSDLGGWISEMLQQRISDKIESTVLASNTITFEVRDPKVESLQQFTV